MFVCSLTSKHRPLQNLDTQSLDNLMNEFTLRYVNEAFVF